MFGSAAMQFDIEPINNTLGLFNHVEVGVVNLNYKWKLLIYRKFTTLKQVYDRNKELLNLLIKTVKAEVALYPSYSKDSSRHT